jgi:hypothetical protein
MGHMLAWIGVNIACPIAVSPVFMFLANHFLALTEEQKKNSTVLRTVQEGQLGWVSLAWSAAAIYQAWDYLYSHRRQENAFDLFLWILLSELLLIVGAGFISVGGTMTASEKAEDKKKYSFWSIFVTLVSAAILVIVQVKTA